MSRPVRWLARVLLLIAAGVVLVMLVRAFDSRKQPDLQAWQRTILAEEFHVSDADPARSLEAYLVQEAKLFRELRVQLELSKVPDAEKLWSRFVRDSPSHPSSFDEDWNRTQERVSPQIRGAALLLHGLTDSPYSLRSMAELLADRGYYTLVLRMPGHGTNPGALVDVSFRDWQAAARIGARQIQRILGAGLPFVLVGYSMGGALAVDYVLEALDSSELPVPERLLLLSPAIGVSPAGILASWHNALSWLPYFEKFRWLDILPEYDPFKYNSFPKNAGRQMFLLSREVASGLARARSEGRLERFPSTLAFQSVADRTVSTAALLDPLFSSLASPRHSLVLFDVNQTANMAGFLSPNLDALVAGLENSQKVSYRLTLLTNASPSSRQVVARELGAGSSSDVESTGLAWPRNVYSLSHVAIPFPPDDPLYGAGRSPDFAGVHLGTLAPRGERDLLSVSMNQLMRLRYNPFHAYLVERVQQWLGE